MVLSASSAITLSSTAIATLNTSKLQQEITKCETAIRSAAGIESYSLIYDATVLGNPIGNPSVDTNLAGTLQIQFRDAFTNAGYIVGYDNLTGYWTISWGTSGPEQVVSVYAVYTTVDNANTNTVSQTEALIEEYFQALVPSHTARVSYSGIGTIVSGTAIFTCIISPAGTGLVSGLLTALTTSPYGFTGSNTHIYQVA